MELPWKAEIDGDDVIVRDVIVTAFGGGFDKGDNGRTESGVMNDGRTPGLLGCALPIRSTEAATKHSPLACASKPHIPWLTEVHFWGGPILEDAPVVTQLIDNGPDVLRFPSHAGDLTVAAAHKFSPGIPLRRLSNQFEMRLSYRIKGGAKYLC